jgi:membrane fusion protein, heavy metal efflux system
MKHILIVGSATCLFAVAACRREASQPAKPTPPANEVWVTQKQITESGIATTEVGERALGKALTTTGRVTFSDTRVAHVFSPVTGRVTNLFAGLGQTVRRGDPLALIESPDVGSAVSDLEKAEADLAAAQRDYERQKELYEAHAAAQRDFEAAEATYRKARAERERAAEKSRLLSTSSTSKTAQRYVLRSPIDGQVVARALSPGMEVQGQYSGGTSSELFTIGDLDTVWVVADLFEVDLPRVKIGAPVSIGVIAYPDRQFTGKVDWISGALDSTTRTAKLRCTIDNSSHLLRPEMFATVSITTDTRQELAIPRTAVVRLGDAMVAYVDHGNAPDGQRRFERRIIAVDETEAGNYVPVLRGLAPGERVVSSGAIILSGNAT